MGKMISLDAELLNVLSVSVRITWFSCIMTVYTLFMIERMLGRCRNRVLLLGYAFVKQLVTSVLMNVILRHYYGTTDEWFVLNTLVQGAAFS